jgi:hypothetical protein
VPSASSKVPRFPPSGITPDSSKKEYCTHWIRTGECDFEQVGCVYKHEMPDIDTLRRVGFSKYPSWWLHTQSPERAAGGRVVSGDARIGYTPRAPARPDNPASSSDWRRRKAPLLGARSHPNGVVFDEATGRLVSGPWIDPTTLPARPAAPDIESQNYLKQRLRETRQELREMMAREDANEAVTAGPRLGSPADLLLDLEPSSVTVTRYEARLNTTSKASNPSPGSEPGAVLTPAALKESLPSLGSAPVGAKPNGKKPTHAVPVSPEMSPYRRFFVDRGNGAVGDGRKVKAAACGDGGKSVEHENEKKGVNGTAHAVGNGAPRKAWNGLPSPAKNAVAPTASNGIVPTAANGAVLCPLNASRFAAVLAAQGERPCVRSEERDSKPEKPAAPAHKQVEEESELEGEH